MDRLVSLLQGWFRQIEDTPSTLLLRKLECTFYYLFLILATACFVLPLVGNMDMVPLYLAAAFSVMYAIGLYFLRFKMYVHFGFMLHAGVFLNFLSTLFFESGFYKVGIAMIVTGILSILIIFVFASLGRRVLVENSRVEQQADEAGENANGLNNNPVVANGQGNHFNLALVNGPVNHPNQVLANGDVNHLNPDLANGDVNHLNPDLANGDVNHLNPDLANGDVNHLNPDLANGDVNHLNPDLANGDVNHLNPDLANGDVNPLNPELANGPANVNLNLGNGHAIQPREDLNNPVVQPR